MKNKIINVILFVIIIVLVVLNFIPRKSEVLENNETKTIKQKDMLSMMLETEYGSEKYEMVTRSEWPATGYKFNSNLSKCENGGELTWDDISKKVYLAGNLSDKCYVYFDKKSLGEMCYGQNMASCFKENYDYDAALYYHNTSLENSAQDNSYRYSGGDFTITQKAIDAGFTFFRDLTATSDEGVIKFYCNNEKSTLGSYCLLTQEHYYLLGNDTENRYSTYTEVLNKAIDLGYVKKDNVKNYVCFGSNDDNCSEDNLYRIIGIFDNNVKIVKAYPATRKLLGEDGAYYGYYKTTKFWSASLSSVYASDEVNYLGYYWNKSTGTNIWSESNLNKINLNNNYLNNIGTQWSEKIENYSWNVTGDTYENLIKNLQQVYNNEINNSNPSLYEAKVGLLYISDYYYGVDKSYWHSPYYSRFNVNDWLFYGGSEHFITPISNTTTAMATYGGQPITWNTVNVNIFDVRPSFYLKSVITLVSGNGTIDKPYHIN